MDEGIEEWGDEDKWMDQVMDEVLEELEDKNWWVDGYDKRMRDEWMEDRVMVECERITWKEGRMGRQEGEWRKTIIGKCMPRSVQSMYTWQHFIFIKIQRMMEEVNWIGYDEYGKQMEMEEEMTRWP